MGQPVHSLPPVGAAPSDRSFRARSALILSRRAFRPSLRTLWLTVGSLALFVVVWELVSRFVVNPYLIPPPSAVLSTAIPMFRSGELAADAEISLSRIGVGFAAGSLSAIVVGVFMGRLRLVNDLLDPIIEVLRYLSPTAMIQIAVIWFGIGELSKYFLIFWGTFFIVLINTIAGVIRTPVARQRAARCMGATNLQVFVWVVIPSAVPYIVTGMRVAMASAFMSIIPAEMLAADSGLGYLLQQSGLLVETTRIFVALAVISLLGFATDRMFRFLVHRTLSRYMTIITTT